MRLKVWKLNIEIKNWKKKLILTVIFGNVFFSVNVLDSDFHALLYFHFFCFHFSSGSSRLNGEVETDGAKVRAAVTDDLILK